MFIEREKYKQRVVEKRQREEAFRIERERRRLRFVVLAFFMLLNDIRRAKRSGEALILVPKGECCMEFITS